MKRSSAKNGYLSRAGWAAGLAVAVAAIAAGPSHAANGTWIPTAAGTYTWSTGTAWSGGVPNGVGESARITTVLTGSQTITLASPITLGSLTFGNASTTAAFSYTLTGSAVTMDTGATSGTAALTLSTVSASTGRAGGTVAMNLILNSNLLITNSIAGTGFALAVNGTISEAAAGRAVTFSSPGNNGNTITVGNNNNSYTGRTTINSGLIQFGSIANVGGGNSSFGNPGNAANGTIALGNATNAVTLVYTGTSDATTDRVLDFAGTNQTVTLVSTSRSLTFTSPLTATGSTGTKLLNLGARPNGGAGGTVNISGNITYPTLSVVADAEWNSTWALAIKSSLTGLNTYSGSSTVGRGILIINSIADWNTGVASSLGAPMNLSDATIRMNPASVSAYAYLQYTGTGHSSNRPIALTDTTGTSFAAIDASGSGKLTLSGSVTNTGTGSKYLDITGTGVGELSGVVSNGTASSATVFVSKKGAGTWILSGSNQYTGATTGSAGILRLDSAGALPGGIGATPSGPASSLTIAGGVIGLGAGDFQRPLGSGSAAVQWTGTVTGGFAAYGADRTVNFGGANAQVVAGTNGFLSNGLVLGADDAASSVTVSNPIDLANVVRAVAVNGTAPAYFSGVLSGTGASGLSKSGSGTLVLSAANTYAGATTINAGRLRVDNAAALPGGNVSLANTAGATLDLNGRNVTIGGTVSGAGSTGGTISLGGGASTFGAITGTFAALNMGGGSLTGTIALPAAPTTGVQGVVGLGSVDMAGGTLTLNSGGATQLASGSFANVGGGKIVKTGLGTLSMVTGLSLPTVELNQGGLSYGGAVSGTVAGLSRTGKGVVSVQVNTSSGTGTVVIGGLSDGIVGPWAMVLQSGTATPMLLTGGTVSAAPVAGTIPSTNTSGTGIWTVGSGTQNIASVSAYAVTTAINSNPLLNVSNYLKTNALIANYNNNLTVTGGTVVIPSTTKELVLWAASGYPGSGSTVMMTINSGIVEETPGDASAVNFAVYRAGSAADKNLILNLNGANNFSGPLIVGSQDANIGYTSVVIGNGSNINSTIGDVNFAQVRPVSSGTPALTVNTGGTSTVGSITSVQGVTPYVSLLKTGSGVLRITGTAGNYTGVTTIQQGVVEVSSLTNAGVAGPLGAPTGANATIALGGTAGALSGTLRYVGATAASTDRGIDLTGTAGGGGIDASGGAWTMSGAVAGGSGVKTFTLGGTSTALNTIGTISGTGVSVVKDGTGLWRMTAASKGFGGALTVRNGTLQVANAGGIGSTVAIGDTAAGATGVAALLLEAGVAASASFDVAASAGTQAALIGNTSGTSTFGSGEIRMSRDVTLVAAPNGAVDFATTWSGPTSGSRADRNVTVGAAGYTGRVLLTNSGTLATDGSFAVRYGTASIGLETTVSAAGTTTIDGGATLGGNGRVVGALGGAGMVAPGNSPGILTAASVDLSGGIDFSFELGGATPDYANPATSNLNDVLRLTGTAPFSAFNFSSQNAIDVYFTTGSLTVGNTFQGGFFTDVGTDFYSTLYNGGEGAAFRYFVASPSGTTSYNGGQYVSLSTYNNALAVSYSTVSATATFYGSGSATSGRVLQFAVGNSVTPTTYTLAATPGELTIIRGGTTWITAAATNTGTGSADALAVNGLGVSVSAGSAPSISPNSGTAVAGFAVSGSGAFTTNTPGSYTFTPGILTAVNVASGSAASASGTTPGVVTVLDHSTASLAALGTVTSATISLGTWDYVQGQWTSGTNTAGFSLYNLAAAAGSAYTAALNVTGTSMTGNAGFATNFDLATFQLLAGGSSAGYSVTFDPTGISAAGSRTATFTFETADQNLSGGSSGNTLTVTTSVIVVPEPATLALAGLGAIVAGLLSWGRRRAA